MVLPIVDGTESIIGREIIVFVIVIPFDQRFVLNATCLKIIGSCVASKVRVVANVLGHVHPRHISSRAVQVKRIRGLPRQFVVGFSDTGPVIRGQLNTLDLVVILVLVILVLFLGRVVLPLFGLAHFAIVVRLYVVIETLCLLPGRSH